MSKQYQQPVPVVVVTDSNGDEALYVDGYLALVDGTIYATDIAVKTQGMAIRFSHSVISKHVEAWPGRYADLVPYLEVEE